VDPTELRQAFLHREHRVVTTTATFPFQSNRYRVADYLRRQKVELRYDPFDLTRMEVWLNNTFLQIAEPDQIVTTVHRNVEPDPRPVPSANTGLAGTPRVLALLRTERERLLQQRLQGIRFSQLPSPEESHDRPE